MRILGLDPGLQTTGYGILEARDDGPHVLEAGVIRSDAGKSTDMAPRLITLYDGLVEVLDQWKPDVMVVEQLYAHYDHPRTAILMAHARGCYFLAGAQAGAEVVSHAATRVKKTITGHGRASKEQMQHAIQRELGLKTLPEPHDVSDALALALCHYFRTAKTIATGSRSVRFQGVNLAMLHQDDDEQDDDV
jgi:crossover junction endodeoxyribonuclease RuvC